MSEETDAVAIKWQALMDRGVRLEQRRRMLEALTCALSLEMAAAEIQEHQAHLDQLTSYHNELSFFHRELEDFHDQHGPLGRGDRDPAFQGAPALRRGLTTPAGRNE